MRRMIQEAEEYRFEDEIFLRMANAKNELDGHIYKISKALEKENISSKLSSKEKEDINFTISRAIDCLNQIEDIAAVENCLRELKTIFERIMVVEKGCKRKRSS